MHSLDSDGLAGGRLMPGIGSGEGEEGVSGLVGGGISRRAERGWMRCLAGWVLEDFVYVYWDEGRGTRDDLRSGSRKQEGVISLQLRCSTKYVRM